MASNSKKRRRVLGASCILAALIIASSSFAWFTSKDEVTNRLSATADYGVSIVEDFTPPKDMTPGQVVNKDVSAVNTGSVDAFTRVSFDNEITLDRLASQSLDTAYTEGKTYYLETSTGTVKNGAMTNETTSFTVPTGDTKLYDLRKFGDAGEPTAETGTELVKLNPIETKGSDGSLTANEVTTLMAGGRLIVEASVAVAPEDQIERSGDDINGRSTGYSVIYSNGTNYLRKDGDTFYILEKDENGYYRDTDPASTTTTTTNLKVVGLARDYSGTGQYAPTGNGLYIFKRNSNVDDAADSAKYSGFYYYDGDFYALQTDEKYGTDNSRTAYIKFDADGDGTTVATDGITYDTTGVVSKVVGVRLLSKESKKTGGTGTDGTFTMSLTATKGGTALTANYDTATYMTVTHRATGDPADGSKDVIFYVKLDDDWADNWTYVPATVENGAGWFYYNKKLESGETSEKLIDSVELADTMTTKNYLNMTYDLNSILESVQVTKDEYNNETMTAVPNTWAKHKADYNNDGNFNTEIDGDGIIDAIQWTAT